MIPFTQYADQVEQRIEKAHGVHVVTRDVPDPLIGDLNGAEIHIDFAVTAEQRLFLLAHLFGHTVQWNIRPEAFELGQPRKPPVNNDSLPALMDYEREAARYALGLFHEIGITGADQWFSDYAACDNAYLRHFYLTGEKKDFQSFWRDGTPLIEAQPVPAFVPIPRVFRTDGIVI
jgi:hypothetical protein